MALGRPANKDTQNKVVVHTIGRHRYASTKVFTVGEDGKKRYAYKHWGTLEDGDRFHPGTNYFYASVAERDRLIFPVAWDMSEVTELSSTRRRGRVSYQDGDVDRQYGATWLLDKVAEATGVKDDLLKVLGGNHEMVDDVLTLAYFPFIENLPYNQLSQWQKEVKAPSEHELNSVSITRLTQSITERHRMDLFRCRARRVGRDELCAVDSTSMSTYGFNLVDIRWGKNKERLPLRQTLEVVVYSLTSHMPIYYKELPGNMPDCRTVGLIMRELEHAGFKNLVLVTDRGYESMKNLELYIAKGQKVITSVKVTGSDVMAKIKAIDMSHGFPQGMTIAPKDNLYYAQYDMEYSVKGNGDNVIKADKYRLNLYYNPLKRGEKICDIQHSVSEQSAELDMIIQTKEPVADREDTARRFNLLDITFNADGTIKSYGVNQKKLDTMLLTAGFFASKTIGVDFDPLQAMDNYGMRDEQEKCFALQKGPLGHDRLRTWSEGGKRGRMLIYFVGLILASYVRSVWQRDEVLRKRFPSTEAVLAEMRTIRCIEHTGKMKFITPFVGSQVDICRAFGFDIPDGCAPVYVSKAKPTTRKRGRPAKAKVEKQEL
uniref:IS1634 family transposase n=1 Tax=Candidatus Cryptobacteroides bacterium TaxID=3085639 RepID=UPI0040292D39